MRKLTFCILLCLVMGLLVVPQVAIAAETHYDHHEKTEMAGKKLSFLSSPHISDDSVSISQYAASVVPGDGGGSYGSTVILLGMPGEILTEDEVMQAFEIADVDWAGDSYTVEIQEGVIGIGEWAFSHCHGMTGVEIPDSVVSIGSGAFYACTSLARAQIPEEVIIIEECVFEFCTDLWEVELPESLVDIGPWAFYECYSLWKIVLPDSLESIGEGAFEYCESLTGINIPSGLVQIGFWAFSSSGLQSIDIPSTLVEIGYWAFWGCNELIDVTLHEGLKIIEHQAFSWCAKLTSINIPASVTYIGDNTFGGDESLIAINVASDNKNYSSEDGVLFNKDETRLIIYPGGKPGAYAISSSVVALGDYVFSYCQELTSLDIPESVVDFGYSDGIFSNCPKLAAINVVEANPQYTSLDGVLFNKDKTRIIACPGGKTGTYFIPEGVRDINNTAFRGCANLTGINIPSSVTYIGWEAFAECNKLTSLTIPKNVNFISGIAFADCENLRELTFLGAMPPEFYERAFDWFINQLTVYVPASGLSAYKALSNIFPTGTTFIGVGEDRGGNYSGSASPANYTITFESNGGSVVAKQTVVAGAKAAKPASPSKDGYILVGWFSDKELSKEYNFDTAVNSSFTLYAKWTEAESEPENKDWQNPFGDVRSSDWFYGAVRFVSEEGLMNGTGSNVFSPDLTLSRAMLVTMLYRLEGEPAVSGDIPFEDVSKSQWYSDAILWAGRNQMVEGYANGKFGSNDPLTREQTVTILYRYAQIKELDASAETDLSVYNDVKDISSFALPAMKWAVATGIIQGRTAATLAPKGSSTRAEIATIIKRFIEGFLDRD